MKNYRSDIMWAMIIIVAIYFIFFGKIWVFGLIVAICACFTLSPDESKFWENRQRDEEEPEHITEPERERPAYSLRVDESQFWENQHHDEEEPQTDYSGLNPCFREDMKRKKS